MVHVSLPRGFSAFGRGWYAMSSAWAIGFGVSPILQECKGKKKDFQKWSNIFHALAAKHSNQAHITKLN
jgi:hypothetical protein